MRYVGISNGRVGCFEGEGGKGAADILNLLFKVGDESLSSEG